MGNIGDELGLHPFAAQAFLHGVLHPLLHLVQVIAAAAHLPHQVTGIHRGAVIALGQCPCAPLQGNKPNGNIHGEQRQHKIKQYHGQRQHRRVAAEKKDEEKDSCDPQGRFPDQRDGAYQMTKPAPYGFNDFPCKPDDIPNDIVFKDGTGLAAGDKGNDEEVKEIEDQHPPQRHCQAGHVKKVFPENGEGGNEDTDRHDIQRDLIKPCEVDALKSLPMAGGGHLPEEAEQRKDGKQRRQRDESVFHIQEPQTEAVFVGAGQKAILQRYCNGYILAVNGQFSIVGINKLGVLRQVGQHQAFATRPRHRDAVAVLGGAALPNVPGEILGAVADRHETLHLIRDAVGLTAIQHLPAGGIPLQVDIIGGEIHGAQDAGRCKCRKHEKQQECGHLQPCFIKSSFHYGVTSIL